MCSSKSAIFLGTISLLTILALAAPRGSTNNSQDMDYWYEQARIALRRRLQYATEDERKPHAKNVILFVGDGMGVATITAARILRGQRLGKSGEEHELVWDSFPAVALAKTYNMNAQIGESSACATALMCGIKTNFETVGLDSRGRFENCVSSFSSKVPSLIDWAQEAGKSTGIVTNTRITHATPAALYGHSPSRYWEDDSKIPPASRKSCKDLARQLIENDPGRNINVLLGGGRRHWLPKVARDPERTKEEGRRLDGRNLIDDWIRDKKRRYLRGHYVWNKTELAAVNPDEVDYLLGLFAYSHMDFETDRDPGPKGDPSLADMTRTALSVLQKNPKGFFLFVEGGRIDHAHHFNNAYRALDETLAMENALLVALSKVSPRDTLLIVTSDHSHVLTMGGQATPRGHPILGPDNKMSDVDGQPYSLLLYGNGPGYSSPRIVPQNSSTPNENRDQMHSSAVPRQWATHGGEDVPVYSIGPLSTILFTGTFDQSYIPHAIAYSACLGEHTLRCRSVHNSTQHHQQQQQTPQVCFPHPPEVYPSISKSGSAISDDDVVVRQKEVVAAKAGQPDIRYRNFATSIVFFSITCVIVT
ncbi:alkaline phosphatase-like [Agrilus planipennis]|uniref:alkaline phosphatase n=1 Tax=Agrilus planipennis TaxID=224129 RepID=A0A1W4X780_AGRPL|nr:alkaline phosphatase-like [Agrilus planipennis]XP_025829073.1 alkaline phosphatase-like [Agrilus planipennis]